MNKLKSGLTEQNEYMNLFFKDMNITDIRNDGEDSFFE